MLILPPKFAAYRLPTAVDGSASPSRPPLQKVPGATTSFTSHNPFQPTRPPAPGARAPVTKTVKPPALPSDDVIGRYDGGLEKDQAERERNGQPSSRMSDEAAELLALDSSCSKCVVDGVSVGPY